jgi:hypothetical protein
MRLRGEPAAVVINAVLEGLEGRPRRGPVRRLLQLWCPARRRGHAARPVGRPAADLSWVPVRVGIHALPL